MRPSIQTLPSDVVHLIAAGEVIDSLAAVVRELVENSLDAGATRITVSLYPERWRVQVADNGHGITLTDLRLCASAHSTSKIQTSDDLGRITSLGFRGEALHSLTQLADVEIVSRSSADPTAGWRILYQGGHLVAEATAAIAPGTIVTVSELFGNWAARRQGLPPLSQQLKAVQNLIGQIALCHPHVTWQVWQNERLWFKISPGTAQQVLPQLLSSVRSGDLQELQLAASPNGTQSEEAMGKIELVVGLPDRCHRRRLDWVRVAVNGRVVRSQPLEQTIVGAFTKTLPRDRYPVCFLHLKISPNQIDWNRHPAKTEIYLHSMPHWQEQVTHAIEQALRLTPASLPAAVHNRRIGKLLQASEKRGAYRLTPERQQPSQQTPLNLIELRAVAQVRQTYIVAEYADGLWLVEQHIAHERVLYEQLQASWTLTPLETPIVLAQLTTAQREQLERLGLAVEPFGEELWAVRSAPELLVKRDDCADALIELSLGGDVQSAQVATACRSAIRNGTPLDLAQMQTLLDQWQNTRTPHTCPHGRPIYMPLEETSLARFFRRHWVIGKSHGI
ncbi:MAG: DNA mismatch repair endonuclease MutL [Cyanophyceae cyanobacterium]